MEIVYFTLIAIAVYALSDWILERLELMRGERFEYRTLIFFALMMVLALGSFWLIRQLVAS